VHFHSLTTSIELDLERIVGDLILDGQCSLLEMPDLSWLIISSLDHHDFGCVDLFEVSV
jgi:hypothetical protein